MISKLIIIRGNSGSGKTTIAKRLQRELGKGTMLVPQDVLRREIVWVRDGANNPSIELIKRTVLYAKEIGYGVILEGILAKKFYGGMIDELVKEFGNHVLLYHFDLTFEETLRRHATKPNSHDFGEKEMREWWNDNDGLGFSSEYVFHANDSEDDVLAKIVDDFRKLAIIAVSEEYTLAKK
ncbi:MAG: kinase [Candidatus Saccharimonas sp.]